ncbi:MAG: hypothetical protein V4618_13380 [Pseudomonadota bacterium]
MTLFHPRLLEAWEAYQGAAATFRDMHEVPTPQVQLFEQAVLLNKLQKEFAAAYDRFSGPRRGLRVVGGQDAGR